MDMYDASTDFETGSQQKTVKRLRFPDNTYRIQPVKVYDKDGNLKQIIPTEELEKREAIKNMQRDGFTKIVPSKV